MKSNLIFVPNLLLVALLIGCASTPKKNVALQPEPSAASEAYGDQELMVLGEPTGPDALQVYSSETLYLRAVDLMSGGAYAEAIFYFEKLINEFPASDYVLPARYNLGNCYLKLQENDRAMASMDLYLEMLPPDATAQDRADAIFRQGHVFAQKKEYDKMARLFDAVQETTLPTPMKIEAMVNAGIGYFMLQQIDTAKERFQGARKTYMDAPRKERVASKYHAAQSLFYLAELKRNIYAEFTVVMPSTAEVKASGQTLEELLVQRLEKKCQYLLNAQKAYVRTIRDGHAGWSSAAGYKVGTLYEDLYDSLETLPIPPDFTEEEKEVYEEMVKERIAVLLRKAVRIWQMTMRMAVRTGADNVWVNRTAASIARVKGYLSAEKEEKIVKEHEITQAMLIEATYFPKRVLGVDLGLKKTGLAISDELGISVRAIETFQTRSRKEDIAHLVELVKEHKVEAVVIGYPLLPDSKQEGMMAKRARGFLDTLQDTLTDLEIEVPVFLEDETGSTLEAEKRLAQSEVKKSKRKKIKDSEAARVIVERFLEKVQSQEAAHKRNKEKEKQDQTEPAKKDTET